MKKLFQFLACSFLFTAIGPSLYAQRDEIEFENITQEQGLSSNGISGIVQDKFGFIWIATYDGLNRYDGYEYTVFKHDPDNLNSISNNYITEICFDRLGNLWIGTLGSGLNKYDISKGKFTRYQYNPKDSNSLSNDNVSIVFEDNQGYLWVGTYGGGLNKFDEQKGQFQRYKHNPDNKSSLSDDRIHCIYEDDKRILWIGTSKGLNALDKKSQTFKRYQHNPDDKLSISGDKVRSICQDNSGIFWIAATGGLNKFDRDSGLFTLYSHNPKNPNSLSNNMVWFVYKDKSGILWLGTEDGLNKFDVKKEQFVSYFNDPNNPASLSDKNIVSLFEDNSGVFWIGTIIGGINKFNKWKKPFIRYQQIPNDPGSLSNNTVFAISEGMNGTLWIGTFGGGLNKLTSKQKSFTHYRYYPDKPSSLSSDFILNVYEDRNGNLWVGTFGKGVDVMVNGTNTFKNYRHNPNDSTSLSRNDVILIYEDKSDEIWIGTISAGLNKLNKQNDKFIRYQNRPADSTSLSNNDVGSICEDKSGTLWFGTNSGLNRFNKKSESFTRFLDSPNNHTINSIHEDNNGFLWIGTDKGLYKYIIKENKFIHYGQKDGLPSNLVYGVLEDNHGNIWLSSSAWLSRFNPANELFRNYDKWDGLFSKGFTPAFCKRNNGELLFGGYEGFLLFHPDSIKDNPHIPPVVITDFLLFNKSVPIGLDTSRERTILQKSIIQTKELELTYEDYIFSFEFAALDFHAPEKNKYAYMMEGFDKDWTYTDSKKRFATYTNLDPGEYVFRVKGSNNDGIWNEEGASLKIIITPPWWSTWWAYTFYVLFGIGLMYSFRRYERNREGYKHGLELEKVEAEKLRETDRMKSHFFANISHEFRTPLTLILGPAEKINPDSPADEIKKQTGLIKRNANRLLNLVNQLLDLSKLEAGKLKVRASKGNIVSFVKGIAMSFESIAEKKDIQLRIKPERDEIEMYFDKDMMTKILSNLLSNSFKFTKEGGEILVALTLVPSPKGRGKSGLSDTALAKAEEQNEGTVLIKVRDTGIGIAAEELPKLFDRFYQVDASHTREYEGTGIGLALTKELVELHHGTIRVESKKEENGHDGWTEFTIRLPLGKEHFEEDEVIGEEITSETELIKLPEAEYILSDKTETDDSHLTSDAGLHEEDKMIILVVEDNADVRDFIRDSLGNEFKVEEAFNGEHGVKKAEAIIPDLIISDIMMPKMDGNELTRILKNDEKTSHIPIILLTAKSEQESKLEGLEIGADEYITKPFDTKELQLRIKNLINIRRKLQEKYSKGDFIPVKTESEKKLGYLDEQFISKVMEVIEKHLSEEEFSIEQFGKEVGMSRMQLHRKLKALSGKSASSYLRSVRLSKAKKMIEEQRGTISEIAYNVGFSSPQYFTRCFKEEFGYPPSEVKT